MYNSTICIFRFIITNKKKIQIKKKGFMPQMNLCNSDFFRKLSDQGLGGCQ